MTTLIKMNFESAQKVRTASLAGCLNVCMRVRAVWPVTSTEIAGSCYFLQLETREHLFIAWP